jgi:hypothetical protein
MHWAVQRVWVLPHLEMDGWDMFKLVGVHRGDLEYIRQRQQVSVDTMDRDMGICVWYGTG